MTDEELECQAKAMFEVQCTDAGSWEELEEWQRESWRCEIDEDRDLSKMVALAKEAEKLKK